MVEREVCASQRRMTTNETFISKNLVTNMESNRLLVFSLETIQNRSKVVHSAVVETLQKIVGGGTLVPTSSAIYRLVLTFTDVSLSSCLFRTTVSLATHDEWKISDETPARAGGGQSVTKEEIKDAINVSSHVGLFCFTRGIARSSTH